MKYLVLCLLLLTGCSNTAQHSYTTTTVDINTLPECPNKVVQSKHVYVTFQADNGDVLYCATHGTYMCLSRKK